MCHYFFVFVVYVYYKFAVDVFYFVNSLACISICFRGGKSTTWLIGLLFNMQGSKRIDLDLTTLILSFKDNSMCYPFFFNSVEMDQCCVTF